MGQYLSLYYVIFMPCYFVYGSLKTNPFILDDSPLPGFEVLSWDSWIKGTLLDLGEDAGLSLEGDYRVHGQVWKLQDTSFIEPIELIRDCHGVRAGLSREINLRVNIPIDNTDLEEISAFTFILSSISNKYRVISEGRWKF